MRDKALSKVVGHSTCAAHRTAGIGQGLRVRGLILATVAPAILLASTMSEAKPQAGGLPASPAPSVAPAGSGALPAQPPGVATQTPPIPTVSMAEWLRPGPGAITAERVGQRALETSYSARAASENLRAAAARVDSAMAAFIPRITGTARYVRLSDFTAPQLGSTQGNIVATLEKPGVLNPTPTFSAPFSFSFPLVLNNYSLQASIVVPISDYFLRIAQTHTAAIHARDAASHDLAGTRARAYTEGKVAFYTWLRARGAVHVAKLALADQKAHLRDAQSLFAVGKATKADVLRAETGVASAELAVERTQNLEALTEKQIRVAMHLGDEVPLSPGESLDGPIIPFGGNVKAMVAEALVGRSELHSLDNNVASLRKLVSVARAGRYPQLGAFGNAYYQNPNQRRFPASEEWFGTWDVGAQLTWAPSDLFTTPPAIAEAESKVSAVEAQRAIVRDGIEVEVTMAFSAVRESEYAVESTKRMLAAAEEAFRTATELFKNRAATATLVLDAETELTRVRLEALNAQVDVRVSRVKLEHALGRTAKSLR